MAEWFLFSPQVRLDIPVIVERAQVTDWWNVPSHQLERLDALRSSAGSARVSVQPAHGVVGKQADRNSVIQVSTKRFGYVATGWSAATRPNCVSTSPRCRHTASNAFTCGSPTSPSPRRSQSSLTP